MASSKIFALFAILALSWSAASATVLPLTAPLAAINNPCMQYRMLQQPFALAGSSFASLMMQGQPLASFLLQQQCNCAAVSQMVQEQQIMAQLASMQLLTMFNPMAAMQQPPMCNTMAAAMQMSPMCNPMYAAMQLSPMCNPMAAAMQLSPVFNAMAAAMQLSPVFSPMAVAMQLSSMFNPMAMASPAACFQPFASGPCF